MGSWTSKLVFLFAGIVAATAFHILPDSTPRSDFKFEVRRANEGSFEVDLWNAGSGEYRSTVGISVSWHTARLVACDGLNGFEPSENGNSRLSFLSPKPGKAFAPGERRMIGWLRLDREATVKVALEKN
jgi:hypothetical protein